MDAPACARRQQQPRRYDGELQRAVAEHRLNAGSTRSHCILTFYVETTTYGSSGNVGGGDTDDGASTRAVVC